jgi:ketosteroid isomerase-like protein
MDRRNVLSLSAITALGLALLLDNALGQQVADVEGVKAASKAFYTALTVLDNGEAMEKVWAHTPYVTYVGPRAKTILVGWDAQKKYWVDTNKLFSERNVTLSDQHIHANGNLAWEMGQESGTAKTKDGKGAPVDYIVTNVYEKIDSRWLIVSHHVQPKPQ